MNFTKSQSLYERAASIIPGGVNSPVRACKSVGADPLFIERGEGCMIYDADGNGYIDYIGSWGPLILGHRHPAVVEAIIAVLERGTSFGAPTDLEIQLAQMVIDAVDSVDVVRMVNSGTEATMSAIRLARGATGRDIVIKFDGCYHGHADTLLVAAGSGVATLGIPGSPGVPEAVAQHTISLPFNDKDAITRIMDEKGAQVACVIVEPVAGNMGMVPPADGFLETLRDLTQQHGAVLIFDEVMTGFRVAYGGAQSIYGITPDLTCFGKVIGGGLPVGAYGGNKDIMSQIAPQGSVYQAGTLSGNPIAMTAGIATLEQLKKEGVYESLGQKSSRLVAGLAHAAQNAGVAARVGHVGSMLGMFFTDRDVACFEDAKTCDLELFAKFYQGMRRQGVYIAPSQFEALFLSTAHSDEHIDATANAAEQVLKDIVKRGS
ncbi:MAG: glutamate-1-semialdehyde 2,1-aminomutase [Deltaproteobacteria bacterium]|jgi:glutamate-1-semialdehyde 2,1-aminomutase|nr:glutamate-1-semialdehyde 2,1-aminomutase [Deltaproteobacteria bacterium]